jgi:hypothetical protein
MSAFSETSREHDQHARPSTVNGLPTLTPHLDDQSTTYDADRRSDPTPNNTVSVAGAGPAFTAKAEGEETRYAIPALGGRKVCRVQVRTTSVVPATGDRASLFSLSAIRSGVAIYTWTPRQGIGAGRTWWDGMVFVAHVKDALADEYARSGRCSVPEAPSAAYQCRGSSGVNHGLAACGAKDL